MVDWLEVRQVDRGKVYRIGYCRPPHDEIARMRQSRSISYPLRVEKPGGGVTTYHLVQTRDGSVQLHLTPAQDPTNLPGFRSDPERLQ